MEIAPHRTAAPRQRRLGAPIPPLAFKSLSAGRGCCSYSAPRKYFPTGTTHVRRLRGSTLISGGANTSKIRELAHPLTCLASRVFLPGVHGLLGECRARDNHISCKSEAVALARQSPSRALIGPAMKLVPTAGAGDRARRRVSLAWLQVMGAQRSRRRSGPMLELWTPSAISFIPRKIRRMSFACSGVMATT